MADIFVSYAREDAHAVEAISRALRAKGFSVFSDRGGLVSGTAILEQIQHEIQTARLVLLVLSKHASKSRWVQQELITALEVDRDRPVVPILIDDEATENVLWPLVANRQTIRENKPSALPELVVSAASRLLSSAVSSSPPLLTRWRTLVLGSVAGMAFSLVAGLVGWNQRLENPPTEVVNLTPFQPSSKTPHRPAIVPLTQVSGQRVCRLRAHGVEYWKGAQQWTADSDWRKGGSSPQEFCSQQAQNRKGQYPDRTVDLLSFGANRKSEYTPFKRDFYRYTCVFEDRWEPVYKAAQSDACPR